MKTTAFQRTVLFSLWLLLPLALVAQTTVKQTITFKLNGSTTTGKVRRDYNVYPATTAGDEALRQAVTSRQISVTLTDGRVLLPVATPGTGSGPSWLSARYSYNATTKRLDVEAAGDATSLRFERQDGLALTGSNPDGVSLNSTAFFGAGPLSGQNAYTQQWAFGQNTDGSGGIPATALKLTWNRTSDNSRFTWTFTPTAGASRTQLFTAANSSPPGSGTTAGGGSFLTYADQGWPRSTRTKWIENDVVKAGFSGETGAVLTHFILKSTGRDYINTYLVSDARSDDPLGRQGTTFEDKGRSVMFGSDYFTPGSGWVVVPGTPAFPNGPGKNTSSYGFDTGGNTVQGGSLAPYYDESQILSSAIVNTSDRGQVFCARIKSRIWGVPREYGHIILDEEIWLDGSALCYKARHTVGTRSDLSQVRYQSREQENPCLYVIAPLTTHITKLGGQEVNRFPTGWNTSGNPFSNTVYSDECWMGAYEGASGIGVTYYSPINSAVRSAQFVDTYGDNTSNASSYLNAALQMNYDNPGVYDDYGYIILGTKAQALTKISTLPPVDQSFDFDFTADNHRWNNLNCRGIRENGAMSYYIGELNQDGATYGSVYSPGRAWQASGITSLTFDMAVTNATTLWLEWRKPGELGDDSKRFRKAFTGLIGDGVRRTYTISTSDPNFSGIISTIGLTAIRADGTQGSNPTTPTTAKIVLYRVKKP